MPQFRIITSEKLGTVLVLMVSRYIRDNIFNNKNFLISFHIMHNYDI